MKYLLIIHGRLDNLNDYITACRTNPYKGSNMKKENEAVLLKRIKQGRKGIEESGIAKQSK